MINERQQAYLDAMGIEVWSLREPVTPAPFVDNIPVDTHCGAIDTRLKLGSGSGGILLICAVDVDSASRLANDISRALGSVPVWAWPDDEPAAIDLVTAVDEKLFTTVAVFGDELAGQFLAGILPDAVNSAKLVMLPSMQDLQMRADARRSLWTTFRRAGMVTKREQQT